MIGSLAVRAATHCHGRACPGHPAVLGTARVSRIAAQVLGRDPFAHRSPWQHGKVLRVKFQLTDLIKKAFRPHARGGLDALPEQRDFPEILNERYLLP
jgi:hypothetical protein